MAEPTALDREALTQLLVCAGQDWDFMAELAETFYEDGANLIQQARQASQAGDAEALRRAAHSLKSNAANFGARQLTQMCKELEAQGKQGFFADAMPRLEQIETEFTAVKAALQALIRQGRID